MSHLRTSRLAQSCTQCCSSCGIISSRTRSTLALLVSHSDRHCVCVWTTTKSFDHICVYYRVQQPRFDHESPGKLWTAGSGRRLQGQSRSTRTTRHLSTSTSSRSAFSSFFERNKPPAPPANEATTQIELTATPVSSPASTSSANTSTSPTHALLHADFERALDTNNLHLLRSTYNKLIRLTLADTPTSTPIPIPTLERGLHLLSLSSNRRIVEDVIRFALSNPNVPPGSLGELGTYAWVKSAYECGRRSLVQRAFGIQILLIERNDRGWYGLDLLEQPVGVVLVVLKTVLQGHKHKEVGEKAFGVVLQTLKDYRGTSTRDRVDLFRGIVDEVSRPDEARRVYAVGREAGIEWCDVEDETITAALLDALPVPLPGSGSGSGSEPDEMREDLERDLRTRREQGRLTIKGWNSLIRGRIRATDEPSDESIAGLIEEMRRAGVSPDQETFQLVLSARLDSLADSEVDVRTLPDGYIDKVWEVSAMLGLDPVDDVWERAFGKVIRIIDSSAPGSTEQERIDSIYTAYENAVRAGARVTIPLAKMIVDRLTSATSTQDYARVNNVRSDLGAAMDESDDLARARSMRMVERDEALRSIYMVCMDGALAGTNVVPDAIALLDEMRRRHVVLGHSSSMRLMISLMDRAEHHHDAFRAYSYVRSLDPTDMGEIDYLQIIQHFIRLVLPKSPWPLPKLTFEFLRDMRDVGIPPQAKVYTMMINEYTRYLRRRRRERAASSSSGELTGVDERIASHTIQTIQKIHSIVKLDSFLDIDLALLTALMDAYNQLQLWPETFEIWNEIVGRHRAERDATGGMTSLQRVAYRPALSVILDACGYSGNLGRARKIWEWAHGRDMIRCGYGNWKSWIETLCRCGKTMEACDIVKGPFKREFLTGEPGSVSRVDEDELPVLEMLVRFSWRDKSDWIEVRSMLETEFPEQWEALKARKVVKGRELAAEQKDI